MNLPRAFICWAVMVGAAIGNDVFAKAFLEKFTGAYGVHLYKTAFIIA
ncbi:MAG: hypothetical protein HZB21_03070, partial [Deltaproteobacteria bacterium]|nr:hypothetical protein [Deltaproteobacteria bacterium]